MSVKDTKPGDTVKAFCPSDYGFKKFEWVKQHTHIPEPRKQTLYGIEVVDMNGNPAPFFAPFFAHPKPFKDSLN